MKNQRKRENQKLLLVQEGVKILDIDATEFENRANRIGRAISFFILKSRNVKSSIVQHFIDGLKTIGQARPDGVDLLYGHASNPDQVIDYLEERGFVKWSRAVNDNRKEQNTLFIVVATDTDTAKRWMGMFDASPSTCAASKGQFPAGAVLLPREAVSQNTWINPCSEWSTCILGFWQSKMMQAIGNRSQCINKFASDKCNSKDYCLHARRYHPSRMSPEQIERETFADFIDMMVGSSKHQHSAQSVACQCPPHSRARGFSVLAHWLVEEHEGTFAITDYARNLFASLSEHAKNVKFVLVETQSPIDFAWELRDPNLVCKEYP